MGLTGSAAPEPSPACAPTSPLPARPTPAPTSPSSTPSNTDEPCTQYQGVSGGLDSRPVSDQGEHEDGDTRKPDQPPEDEPARLVGEVATGTSRLHRSPPWMKNGSIVDRPVAVTVRPSKPSPAICGVCSWQSTATVTTASFQVVATSHEVHVESARRPSTSAWAALARSAGSRIVEASRAASCAARETSPGVCPPVPAHTTSQISTASSGAPSTNSTTGAEPLSLQERRLIMGL